MCPNWGKLKQQVYYYYMGLSKSRFMISIVLTMQLCSRDCVQHISNNKSVFQIIMNTDIDSCQVCMKKFKHILVHLKNNPDCQEHYDMLDLRHRVGKIYKKRKNLNEKEKRRERYNGNREKERGKRILRYNENKEKEKEKLKLRYNENKESEMDKED